MAFSDCPKCCDTPCTCGYEYETWTDEKIRELHGVLSGLLERRAVGEPRRLGSWEAKPEALAAAAASTDWGATITIPWEMIEPKPPSRRG